MNQGLNFGNGCTDYEQTEKVNNLVRVISFLHKAHHKITNITKALLTSTCIVFEAQHNQCCSSLHRKESGVSRKWSSSSSWICSLVEIFLLCEQFQIFICVAGWDQVLLIFFLFLSAVATQERN